MRIVAIKDLGPLRAAAKARIDAAAEERRATILTRGAGQAAVYAAKQAEARRFQAEGVIGPLLTAETGLTAPDAAALVMLWLQREAEWLAAAAEIEVARLKAKAAVDTAQTPAEIDQAARI